MRLSATDLEHLRRAVALARLALERGDEPFGSVLVSGSGEVLFEDHNHVVALEGTQHPEFAIARWAGGSLTAEERAAATVYTSGEHCAMCSAAHGWVGLGPIVYAVSSRQLDRWRRDWGAGPSPVVTFGVNDESCGWIRIPTKELDRLLRPITVAERPSMLGRLKEAIGV